MPDKTIRVEALPDHENVYVMTWDALPDLSDVQPAFAVINAKLAATNAAIYVIVDIRSQPNFPVTQTISEALAPYRHENLAAWLVVGTNTLARSISFVLSRLTRRQNVLWFKEMEAALQHIKDHPPSINPDQP